MRKKSVRKDEKREVTPEFVNMSKEILYPQIQGVTVRQGEATSCEECGRQMKTLGVGPFCPSGGDRLFVNRGRIGNRNNPP
jgi:hypothetical protein